MLENMVSALRDGLETKNMELVEQVMSLCVKEHIKLGDAFSCMINNWLNQQANLNLLEKQGKDITGLEATLTQEELSARVKASAMQEFQDAQAAQQPQEAMPSEKRSALEAYLRAMWTSRHAPDRHAPDRVRWSVRPSACWPALKARQ